MEKTTSSNPVKTRAEIDNRALRPAVVDLAGSTDPGAALQESLSTCGFVAVRNTAVSKTLREQAFKTAHAYFAQDDATKSADIYDDTAANFGYQGMRSEALDPTQGANEADFKEAFTMRGLSNSQQPSEKIKETSLQANWDRTEFGQVATDLYAACNDTAMHLLSLIAKALGMPATTFSQYHTGENTTLRYLHYPVCPAWNLDENIQNAPKDEAKSGAVDKKMPQLGAGAHTDYGTITLLFSDGVAGLQLFDVSTIANDENLSAEPLSGCWRDVVVEPGDVLVNTGDLMSLWSNGLYPSTLHRVLPRLETPDRYSIAFFVDPDSSTLVKPLPSCIQTESSSTSIVTNSSNSRRNGRAAHPITASEVVAGEHIQARIEASQRTLA